MFRTTVAQSPDVRAITDARVKAILKRGMIWDEFEFDLLRGLMAQGPLPEAMAARFRAMLHTFEYGDSEDAA